MFGRLEDWTSSDNRSWRSHLGFLLESALQARRLGVRQAAAEIPMDAGTLSKLINGKQGRITDPNVIARLAKFLGLDEMNIRLAMRDQESRVGPEGRLKLAEVAALLYVELNKQIANVEELSVTAKDAEAMVIEIGQVIHNIGLRLSNRPPVPEEDFGRAVLIKDKGTDEYTRFELPVSRPFNQEVKDHFLQRLKMHAADLARDIDDHRSIVMIGVALDLTGMDMIGKPDEKAKALGRKISGSLVEAQDGSQPADLACPDPVGALP